MGKLKIPMPDDDKEKEMWRINLADADSSSLSSDDVAGTTNQVIVTVNANGTVTLSLPQNINTDADVEFDSITLDDLTAARLISTDGSKKAVSVSDLTAWIAGTANQITVTDDGDGTITLSTPQDIHSGASPTFVGLELTGASINTDSVTPTDLDIDCGANKTIELQQPVWDDARTPISIATKLPGKEPAEVVYKSGIVYEFNTANDEGCAFNVQLSHAYKLGTDIEFHIHYILRTAGAGAGAENVKWDFTHSWADIGDAMPSETTVNTTIDVQNLSADTHYLGEIAGTIDGSGISGVSSMLVCSLTRDVSVADNYADDVLVMEVDFHYQIDTMGSRQEAVK